jgi:hypothetical protein
MKNFPPGLDRVSKNASHLTIARLIIPSITFTHNITVRKG